MTLARRISDRYNNKFFFLFPVSGSDSGSGSGLSAFMCSYYGWAKETSAFNEYGYSMEKRYAMLCCTVLCCHIAVKATPS